MKTIPLKTLTFIAALTLSLSFVSGGFISGALAGGKKHMKHHTMHHMMNILMDTNKDGTVSSQEFQDFKGRNFAAADQNNDGFLNPEEFAALSKIKKEQRKKAMEMAKKKKAKKRFGEMDSDGDGKISKAEYDAKGAQGFNLMDLNKDGALSKNEHGKKMHKMKGRD